MTPEHLRQVESKLTAAILRAQQDGKQVRAGDFGVGTDGYWYRAGDCLCPIGALLYNTLVSGGHTRDAASILGVSREEIWDFIGGFDSSSRTAEGKPLTHLGARFRQRLLTRRAA